MALNTIESLFVQKNRPRTRAEAIRSITTLMRSGDIEKNEGMAMIEAIKNMPLIKWREIEIKRCREFCKVDAQIFLDSLKTE